MKHILFLLSVFTFVVACNKTSSVNTANFTVNVISEDWAKTKTTANTNNQNIMLLLHADWCSVCKNFQNTVFADKDVASAINNKIVIAKIEGEKNVDGPTLMNNYNADGFPTFVICDKDGNKISSTTGGLTKDAFLNFINPYLK